LPLLTPACTGTSGFIGHGAELIFQPSVARPAFTAVFLKL